MGKESVGLEEIAHTQFLHATTTTAHAKYPDDWSVPTDFLL